MSNSCSSEMSLNRIEDHKLLLGLFPENHVVVSCRVIVYGMESLVTGDDMSRMILETQRMQYEGLLGYYTDQGP